MSERPIELPVDVRRKSEVVQDRLGVILVISVMAIITFLLFLLSVNMGFILAKGAAALPDVTLLEQWRPNESTRIFDRNGNLIANIHGDEDRVVVPLSEISPNIQRAVMAIEDNRFYEHGGVDIQGTIRAAVQNLKGGDIQGGSTLTQQLVKNLFLTPERAVTRKLAEAILAMRVEKHYSKNEILEMYLNQVYWGNQSYGIEKAARRYFRKGARDLTIAESALLAGLLKAPEGLSPYDYPEAARRRQLQVLAKMEENGYITTKQRETAAQTELELNKRTPRPSKYPFFVTHVIQELEREFGSEVVRRGGLKVITTLDARVQEAAEEALLSEIKRLPKYTNVSQGALVAIDVETSEIMALVGGVDFEKSQFNNATQARRAAGSTFKPFVYLTGFRLGTISPESQISDKPVHFNTGFGIWSPKNWDGRFMGPMSVRKALTLSRNTTTVQIGMKLGIDEVINTARLAGVESPIDRNFSSLLGSSGFSPLEMTASYATFARGGIRMRPTAIRQIEDSRGHEVELEAPKPERAFDPEPVANLVSILVDVVEKGTGRSAMLPGRQVAGKTGTTDKVRDIWFMGFTPDMVAGVWMGNTDYVPLNGVFSSNAAKVWGEFAKAYYEIRNIPSTKFPDPQPILVKKSVIETEQKEEGQAPVPPGPTADSAAAQQSPDVEQPSAVRAGAGVSEPSTNFAPLIPQHPQRPQERVGEPLSPEPPSGNPPTPSQPPKRNG